MNQRKKRVLFIRSNPVDPDTRVEKEARALVSSGYDVEILAWDRTSNHAVKTEYLKAIPSVLVHRIGIESQYAAGFKKNLIPLFKFQVRLSRFLVKNHKKYDVIHACDFDTAFATSKVCAAYHIPLIYDVFDYYVDSFSVPRALRGIVEAWDHKIMNKAAGVIICTEQRKVQLGNVSPYRLTVIHNSPELPESILMDAGDSTRNVVKIAYVGILSYGRGIEAICRFVSQNPAFELHIGGFGILEEMVKEYSEKFRNIFFYGKIPYVETLSLENACDIITAIYDPSVKNHLYAAPNKFYEGLLLGKPLVMVKGTGMADIVESEKLGVVCEFDNIEAGLTELAEKSDEWSAMGVRAKALYEKSYSWTEMKRRLLELYESI